MKQRIFVYGTLKRAGRFSNHMIGQEFVGEARTEPVYRMVDLGGYPGMYPAKENGVSIHGEVWDVDAACRLRLDELEDVAGGEYELRRVRLVAPFDTPDVFTYLYLRIKEGMPDAGTNWPESR